MMLPQPTLERTLTPFEDRFRPILDDSCGGIATSALRHGGSYVAAAGEVTWGAALVTRSPERRDGADDMGTPE